MQYQVPQFIEVEDKIFGPLTLKQFVYLVGGGGLCYIIFKIIPFPFSFLFILPIAGFSLALAFYKVNNRPFINVVESAIKYAIQSKLYIWKKEERKVVPTKREVVQDNKVFVPKLSNSKLRDLTWSLDIHETIYSKEKGLTDRDNAPKSGELNSFKGLTSDMINLQK